jgi:hypothetical protein
MRGRPALAPWHDAAGEDWWQTLLADPCENRSRPFEKVHLDILNKATRWD